MKRILNDSGFSMVVVTVSMLMILGVTALVTDIGLTIYEKEKLGNAIDAATLAAMQDIDKSDQVVLNTAKQYAQLNGVDPNTLDISINQDRKGLTIKSQKQVNYFFARVVGINNSTVGAQSKSKIAPLTSFIGIRPLAIADQPLEFNKQYTLKEGAGDDYSGNYGGVALGGSGAAIYRNNIMYGYEGNIKIGDNIETEPGNMSGPTKQGIQYLINQDYYSNYTNYDNDSTRVIVLPIVNTLSVEGRKTVTVVGFAAFFVEGLVNSGGHTDVVGRFVKHIAEGEASDSQTDYGLRSIKLTN